MSTNYYMFSEPVTSVKVLPSGNHHELIIWINHEQAGKLVLKSDELTTFMDLLHGKHVATTHWGGADLGMQLTWTLGVAPDNDVQLVSDYHEITTVRELKALVGKVRA